MGGFVENLIGRLRNRTYATALEEHCFGWRDHPTPYAVGNAVRLAAQCGRADIVSDALEDEQFRKRLKSTAGINALRESIRIGLDFFSRQKVDFLEYIRLLFHERTSRSTDAKTLAVHRAYGHDFADFLQLNVPPNSREDIGVHHVLNTFFPLSIEPDHWERKQQEQGQAKLWEPLVVRLVSYEIGRWRCRCGHRQGHRRRFDYACICGALKGQGRLDACMKPCHYCREQPAYSLCPMCGTRVTLDLLLRIPEGNVHPSEFLIPLTVDLKATKSNGAQHELSGVLINLPLMLGMQERDQEIVFGLPNLFWLNYATPDPEEDFGISGYLLSLKDSVRYDRKTQLREILEAALRRTLQGGEDKRRSLRAKLKRILVDRKGELESVAQSYTKGFKGRLARPTIVDRSSHEADLVRLADLSRECTVVASPHLKGNMAVVNRQLIVPGGFVVSSCTSRVVSLRRHRYAGDITTPRPPGRRGPRRRRYAEDILTPRPPGRRRSRLLGNDGIVSVGTVVRPGDVLVGIASEQTTFSEEEKRLLEVAPSRLPDNTVDASLTYDGSVPGRVIAVEVHLRHKSSYPEVKAEPGKAVSRGSEAVLSEDELARVELTLAVDYGIGPGDVLCADDGVEAVVCDIAGGPSLSKALEIPIEPEVIVAPDHPWSPKTDSDALARRVSLSIKSDTLLVQKVAAHSTTLRTLIHAFPMTVQEAGNRAQDLTIEDFDWLLAHEAFKVAIELIGPHSDCVEWRTRFYESQVRGDRCLQVPVAENAPNGRFITKCPSESLRHLAVLLEGAGIELTFEDGTLCFGLVSHSQMRSGSFEEVIHPETFDFRTYWPEIGGLLCERMLGQERNWECACGKYKGMEHEGLICDRCGVEITRSRVRRLQTSRFELTAPVVHRWFFKTRPSRLGNLLGMKTTSLEKVIYFQDYVVTNPGDTPLRPQMLLTEEEYRAARAHYPDGEFEADMGAEAIRKLLTNLDLVELCGQLRKELAQTGSKQKRKDLTSRLKIAEAIHDSNQRPEWIVLDVIPVIPPDLRPLVLLESGHVATSDLDGLYRRIVNRNDRLRKLNDLNAPEVIIRNEERMLQQAVDALLDNSHLRHPVLGALHRPLSSIAGLIEREGCKEPTLLEGLLRRSVDYSACTRIVAGDTASVDHAGLPERLAWKLLEPLVVRRIRENEGTIRESLWEIRKRTEKAYVALTEACEDVVILAAVDSSPFRVVALRPHLTKDLTLRVCPSLLDFWGWDLLGKSVRLFAILSQESQREALEKLTPSQLRKHRLRSERFKWIEQEKRKSPWYLPKDQLIRKFVRRALGQERFPLGIHDRLLLCMRD